MACVPCARVVRTKGARDLDIDGTRDVEAHGTWGKKEGGKRTRTISITKGKLLYCHLIPSKYDTQQMIYYGTHETERRQLIKERVSDLYEAEAG